VRVKRTQASWWLVPGTGLYAVLCAPLILLAERYGWSEGPFHVTQLLATLVCFLSSIVFIRGDKPASVRWQRAVAIVALTLSGLWLAVLAAPPHHGISSLDFAGLTAAEPAANASPNEENMVACCPTQR
jgi:hypothetical protein